MAADTQSEPRKARRTANAYLQELQKQVEEHRRSPSSTIFDSQKQPGDAPYRSSPTAQAASAPPQYRSPLDIPTIQTQSSLPYCSPPVSQSQLADQFSPGLKRTSDVAFGPNGDVDGECRVDTALASPALTAEGTQQHAAPSDPAQVPAFQPTDSPLSIWPSAFTIPSKIIKNTRKNRRTWIWLAPWSTWSFTLRLMLMLGDKLQPGAQMIPPQLVENDIYTISWNTQSPHDLPDISGLPSLDHAIYLFYTFKFHLGQTYRLFDEVEFENQIREFYANAQQKAVENRLWYVKFLLILAFGTAFHTSQPTLSSEPPGSKFFVRAMGLMPDHTALWKDSLLAIEVLAMAGLYLYSIDERESAHVYLGQAIRIAQLEGLHTQLPESELDSQTLTSCRDLWWTLYIMDRHFSSSLGIPMSVQDSDITTTVNPPNIGSQGDSARSLQVNLSHLLSVILTIATRPLLLSVLKERLDILGHPGDENWESFFSQTAAVISTGIKSAVKTLQILTTEYSLLEVFLPYDLEFTFGAALHLNMATALFPGVADDQGCRQLGHQILDNMISRGNRVSAVRKQELVYLEVQCQELIAQVQQQGLQTLSLAAPDETDSELARKADAEQQQRLLSAETDTNAALSMAPDSINPMHCMHPHLTSNIEFLDNIGISSEDFLTIVQQIGDPDTMPENMLTLE
ncbi:uncharacterized protein NECHADRAFT_41510 [Fusarium vanettenii 77-13-4]|uniref:Xylanolytic transcriptional activator regulatory domain-containing protein n=1 Tax=Fusarium vanettenii (strain ATCC MYA-4622 / CBS 123669 / FGSC 9596 / NRRL 45880 / 77-13-4) TaxID=660122 RepID=C7YT62_FUSV7|nr:uncharacterized protein NECHADRAFT_41510 [Fusarium vanettenii 77-13-4]EEU45355.1 predicted protein [Fusarium vanettenii 77-13-4]